MRRAVPVVGALLFAAFVYLLRDCNLAPRTARLVDDAGQVLAATAAATASLWRAGRPDGRTRRSWLLLGLGALSWAAGQAYWSAHEALTGAQPPFPSLADLGYGLLPVLALAAIAAGLRADWIGQGWLRPVLDGLLVASSVIAIGAATAWDAVARPDATTALARAVAVAESGENVLLLMAMFLSLTHLRAEARAGMLRLTAGVAAVVTGNALFAYQSGSVSYRTGNVPDYLWVAGFLTVVAGAVLDATAAPRAADPGYRRRARAGDLVVAYLPSLVAVVVVTWRLRSGGRDLVLVVAAIVAVAFLVLRQVVAVDDNRRLVEQLAHQARHDALTGLPNRVLLAERTSAALAATRQTGRRLSLLLVDLDGFKAVNDRLGHAAGDEVLVEVARRLRELAPPPCTVARLGGDEFAVLAPDAGPACTLHARLNDAVRAPMRAAGEQVTVGASIGCAVAEPGTGATLGRLLAEADAAMYAAKQPTQAGTARSPRPGRSNPVARRRAARDAL